MNGAALDTCLSIALAHASLNLKLDEELGMWHGLGWRDFTLLRLLAQAPDGRMPVRDLVRPMGMTLSAVTRVLLPLEKTGHLHRDPLLPGTARTVSISPAGRALAEEAAATAADLCTRALSAQAAEGLAALRTTLAGVAQSPALAL